MLEHTPPLELAKRDLEQFHANVVIVHPKRVTIDRAEGGILPLLRCRDVDLQTQRLNFEGASVADRIVGKAAAMLYLLLCPAEVYGAVMTKTARDLLAAHGIHAEWGTLTEHIINRKGTDLCPMEKAVAEIDDPLAAEAAIRKAYGPY